MTLMHELSEQPQALRNLAAYYAAHSEPLHLRAPFSFNRLVLTGMGASYHAASIAAFGLARLGIPAAAVEASDALHFQMGRSGADDALWVVISQSGSSGEVAALLDTFAGRVPIVGISNQEDGLLAKKASRFLPMVAGDEMLIASKTYLNTLALVWLLGRSLAGRLAGADFETLAALASRVEGLIAAGPQQNARLLPLVEGSSPCLFLGHGPHAISARQAAMGLAEWAKIGTQSFAIGAFRHGFIETVEAGAGAVIFAPPGSATAGSALTLARDLQRFGAKILWVANGRVQSEPGAADETPVDEFLSPILDIVPVQLTAEELARRRGFGQGFRYISKVVTAL